MSLIERSSTELWIFTKRIEEIQICFFLILLLVIFLVPSNCGLCFEPATEDGINAAQYLGRWYQIAEDPFTRDTTEENAICATANYALNLTSGYISVYNWARLYTVNGNVSYITGYAEQETTHPGRLIVYLDGVPFPAPYWILKLGPVMNNMYSWAVVSDPICASLFVLSRTPTISDTLKNEIISFIVSVGFDASEYLPIQQEGCIYEEKFYQ